MSGMDAAPAKVALEYAKPLRWHQRRRSRWVLLIVCLAAACFAWRASREPLERFRERWAVWRDVRACLGDAPGPQVVAFESQPSRGAPLQQVDGYVGYVGGRAGRLPIYAYRSLIRPMRYNGDPILFMGARRWSEGRERLVVVRGRMDFPGPVMKFHVTAEIWNVDVPFGRGPARVSVFDGPILVDAPPEGLTTTLRLLAGQADPSDASHFTIRYDNGGQVGVIDGRLCGWPGGGNERIELHLAN